ncbi:MAG: AsmA family protein [Sulfuricaulis sp.]
MKKALTILAILIGGVLSLLIILAVTLTLIIDPNDYKGKISEAVKEKTGRELRIDGKLSWSFFPWIGIETGRLEYANAPGFGAEPFAQIDSAGAQVELLPLLHKQIVIDTIFLNGLKLNLARNAAGKTNWADLISTPSKTQQTAATKPVNGLESGIGGLSLNKLDIRQADVTWKDQTSGAQYAVHNLNLKTGRIIGDKPVNADLSFDLESGQPPVRVRVDLKTLVSLDLADQKLDVPRLTLSVGDLAMSASFQGTHVFDAPAISGSFEIATFSPRTLMGQLGIKYATRDKKALDKLALKTHFSATSDGVELNDLAIQLDDSHVSGSLAVRHFAKPAYQFDLALDQIDLDRYLPPSAPSAASGSQPGTEAPAKPVAVPLSALRALALHGKFRIQQLQAMNLHSSNALIQVTADNGLITLGPDQATLYSGKYAGHTTLDVRGRTPMLAIDESVSGVELAPMLQDALQFNKFAGSANLSAKVTAQGVDANQIKQSLNGSATFAVRDGAIKGVDLNKMTDTIKNAQRNNLLQNLAELTPQSGDETRFSQLGGTAQIKNGVVQNNDLRIQSPNLLNVTGKGTADLPRQTLNYTVTLGQYPIVIYGPFSSLRYKPDLNGLLKSTVEKKKSKLEENLKQQLKDRLKLFR